MSSRLFGLLCFVFVLLGLGFVSSSVSSPLNDVSVVDGDSFYLGSVHVRLVSVDTPELPSSRGFEAKSFTESFLSSGLITRECDGFDRYGRLLCEVFVDGVSLSESLLESGHAREWR